MGLDCLVNAETRFESDTKHSGAGDIFILDQGERIYNLYYLYHVEIIYDINYIDYILI